MTQLEMANGPDGTCPYSTLQHKHILVGHAAWDGTHVGRARLRSLGTETLKARHDTSTFRWGMRHGTARTWAVPSLEF